MKSPYVHCRPLVAMFAGAVVSQAAADITVTLQNQTFTGFNFAMVADPAQAPIVGVFTGASINVTLNASIAYTYADDLCVYVDILPLSTAGFLQVGGFSNLSAAQRYSWPNGASSAAGTTCIGTVNFTTPLNFTGNPAVDGTIWIGNGYGASGTSGTWSGTITLHGVGYLGSYWYRDVDGDGIGWRLDGVEFSKVTPPGYVATDGDNCPSIYNPNQADCNGNGVGDVCDLAGGVSLDCDSDGRPDECEGAVRVVQTSGLLPVSGAAFAQATFSSLPRAYGRPPKLTVEATADLGAPNDGLIVTVDGVAAGTLFLADGTDCPSTPNSATITYTLPNFNALVSDGALVVRASAFGAVNSVNCGASGGVRFRLEYDGLPASSDCNGNGQLDSCELGTGSAPDCNGNGRIDSCDIASGSAVDCNGNGQLDSCDIASGSAPDCNGNGRIDSCDIASGSAVDCNSNGRPDSCDIASGSAPDCNGNGRIDSCDIASGSAVDCNGNGRPDSCDIAQGSSTDLNGNAVPDDCEFVVGGSGYATIQAAVAAAPPGTTIRVGPGTYTGSIVLDSKPVSLVSIGGSSVTTLSGIGATASLIAIRGAAASGSVVDGFTLRDGSAGTPEFGLRLGGGMLLLSTTATVRNCRFMHNSTEYGGGIYGYGFNGTIEDCVFEDNSAQFNSGGVQLGFGGTCLFRRNTIARNHAGDGGGGMHVVNWFEGPLTAVTIEDCGFIENTAANQGGALLWYGNQGADLRITRCEVVGNAAADAAFTRVGGSLSFALSGTRFCRNTPVSVIGSIVNLGGNILSDDCNGNGICDADEVAAGTATDCNGNGALDSCDLASGTAIDCNGNGRVDSCDIAIGSSSDVDSNGVPDECSPDCDGDGLPDAWEILTGLARDCDRDSVPDNCEIAQDASKDKNGNGKLDLCELAYGDLNLDGVVSAGDLGILLNFWAFTNPPLGDLNGDGQINGADLATLLANWGTVP